MPSVSPRRGCASTRPTGSRVPTYKLVIEYTGDAFAGWQEQGQGERTVQGCLRDAFEKLTGERPKLMGAGRTDAGVHAEAQVASVSLPEPLGRGLAEPRALARALNGIAPAGLAVLTAELARDDFDARRDAVGKRYRYRIWNDKVRSPLRAARSHWVAEPLDLASMAQAAQALTGRRDFACFQAVGSSVQTTVRELRSLAVSGRPGGEIVLDAEGSGFLRHMVRNLAGTLIEVGLGRRSAESMPELLAGRDRSRAGPTAPAHGLTLVRVLYPGDAPDDGCGDQPDRERQGEIRPATVT